MPTNEILSYGLDGAANVATQATYAAAAGRTIGAVAGLASSAMANKAWRQSAFMAAVLAQFAVDTTGQDQLDDGDISGAVARLKLAVGLTSRIKLTANLVLYVATTGNNSNTGLSSGQAFATLQYAWNFIVNRYDLNGWNVTVNVANGTYTAGVLAAGVVLGLGSGNAINFVGNVGSPTSCVIQVSNSQCIASVAGASLSVSGFSLISSGTPGHGMTSTVGGVINVAGAMNFGTCAGFHMYATAAGTITIAGVNYSINGGASAHMTASSGGTVSISGPATVTLTGTPAFASFALGSLLGLVQALTITYSGSATGVRYTGNMNGVINTNGGGASYFPGNAVGSLGTGAQYA